MWVFDQQKMKRQQQRDLYHYSEAGKCHLTAGISILLTSSFSPLILLPQLNPQALSSLLASIPSEQTTA